MKKIFTILMLLFTIIMFSATTTWNGTSWSSGIPSFNDNAIIDGDYFVGSSNGPTNFICRNLTVNAGSTLTILSGFYLNVGNGIGGAGDFINNGRVIVQSAADFWIYDGILINNAGSANFIIENGGGMIQFGTNTNSGSITFKRNTNPVKQFEYTIWSSPVSNQNTNLLPPSTSNNAVFTYTYPTPLPMDGWIQEPTSSIMALGKGYAIRGPWCSPYPSCFGILPQNTYTMNFVGVPNNGPISIFSNSTNNLHLIGNPFPSSLDLNAFLTTNNTTSFINLWTHNTLLSSTISGNWLYNFTNDDYATYNLTGGVSATSPINDGTPNNSSVPTRYIGSGQGFFATSNSNGPRTFNFSNVMRGYLPNATNTQFYRQDIEQHRIWLFLTDNSLITRYNLVGYVTGADNEYNHQYDADMLPSRKAAIYSVLADKDLVIQGRSLPFDMNDQIPLGYLIPDNAGGLYQIGLNDVDGLFTNVSQPIYLQDLQLNVFHNLRTGPYSFSATAGITENRFVLRFTTETLDVPDYLLNGTVVYNANGNVNIKNDTSNIKNVKVYDVLGRLVHEQDNINEKSLILYGLKGILILKINVDGVIVTKKHII